MLQYCDYEEGRASFEADLLYRVCIPLFLEEGDETFPHVFDVLWLYIFQDVYMDKVPQEVREEPVVVEDELDQLLAAFFALGDMDAAVVKL